MTIRVYIPSAQPQNPLACYHQLPYFPEAKLSSTFLSSISWKFSKTFSPAKLLWPQIINIPETIKDFPSSIPAATSNHPASSIPAGTSNQQQQPAAATSNSHQQKQPTAATNSKNQQQQSTTATSSSNKQQQATTTTSIRPTSSTYTINIGIC